MLLPSVHHLQIPLSMWLWKQSKVNIVRRIRATYMVCRRWVQYKAIHKICMSSHDRTAHQYSLIIRIWQRVSSVLMPKEPTSIVENEECTVQPGCTYEIRVDTGNRKASARMNVTIPGNTRNDVWVLIDWLIIRINSVTFVALLIVSHIRTLTRICCCFVLDCIGPLCACKHGPALPNVTITAYIEASTLHIAWNLSTSNYKLPRNVSLYNVDVR